MASSLRITAGHKLKNLALLLLSLTLLPLSTAIFLAIDLANRFVTDHKHVVRSVPAEVRKTVLITGVNMTKGLVLARLFHKAGHRVVGADTHLLAPGRVSRALDAFYHVPSPVASRGEKDPYVQELLSIVQTQKVDLWVSASDVTGAIPDAVAKEVVERETSAKAIQFGVREIETLHDKDSFMEHTKKIGLTIPDTAHVRTKEDIITFLNERGGLQLRKDEKKAAATRYLVKPVGVDDLGRNDMPLLPLPTESETLGRIDRMSFPAGAKTGEKPAYIIQEFIEGAEYCTHALIVRGKVRTFLACPSSDMLMHYTSLPPTTALHRAMLAFTEAQAESFGTEFTGHMSFDFLIKGSELRSGETKMEKKRQRLSQGDGADRREKEEEDDEKEEEGQEEEQGPTLYPIECNPRVHTAIVILKDTLDSVTSYLSILTPSSEPANALPPTSSPSPPITPLVIPIHPQSYYWIGQDFVELMLYDLYRTLVAGTLSLARYLEGLRTFAGHVLHWGDGMTEAWDPWPCWWLYHVYWPAQFAGYLVRGRWQKLNVSTGKAFQAA